MSAAPIRALLLDFGGTLDADGVAWKERFRRLFADEAALAPDGDFDSAFYAADDALVGSVPPSLAFEETVSKLAAGVAGNLGRPDAAAPVARKFLAESRACLSRSTGVLAALHPRYRLAVVSNFYGNLESVCRETGLAAHLDAAVDSAVVGASKPDPRIFRAALSALEVAAEEAVFVGDSLPRDMAGARSLGMRHVWISPRAEACCCPEDRVIASFCRIAEAVA